MQTIPHYRETVAQRKTPFVPVTTHSQMCLSDLQVIFTPFFLNHSNKKVLIKVFIRKVSVQIVHQRSFFFLSVEVLF